MIAASGASSAGEDIDSAVQLTIVYNNIEGSQDLETDWGFSALVRRDTLNVLFDTGTDGEILLSNMEQLEIDPGSLDIVVISHAHYDHAGGLPALLPITGGRPLLVLCGSFHDRFAALAEDSGCRTMAVGSEPTELLPWLLSTGEMGASIPEQGLLVDTPEGWVLLTGCAHPGILEMTERAMEAAGTRELRLVAGGFHLMNLGREEAVPVAERMLELGVLEVAPSHCTGDTAIGAFGSVFPEDRIHSGGAGWVLSFGD